MTDPKPFLLTKVGKHMMYVRADLEYSTNEMLKMMEEAALAEHINDNYKGKYLEIYQRVQKELLAATPVYRKALIRRATNPDSVLTVSDQEILKVIYEMGY